MSKMFCSASSFNSDLAGWNVSKVTNMNEVYMFARAFNSDLAALDTLKCQGSINGMF